MSNTKNLEIVLEFQNYKKLVDKKIVLSGSNLYLIKGKNDIGKTSITSAIVDLLKANNSVPNAITNGKESASVIGILPGPDGNYTIKMEITPTSTKFTAIDPKNRIINKVTELRALLRYNSVSVNDFINLSRTAKGRREQVEMLINLLPQSEQIEFNNLLINTDTITGSLFLNRKKAKADYETQNNLVSLSPEVKEIDIKKISEDINNKKKEKEDIDLSIKDKISEQNKLVEKYNTLNNCISTYPNVREQKTSDWRRLKAQSDEIIKQMNEIAESAKKLDEDKKQWDKDILFVQEKIDLSKKEIKPNQERISAIEEELISLNVNLQTSTITNKQFEDRNKLIEELNKRKELFDKSETELENARKRMKELSSKISDNISISDEGYVKIGEYVLDENQICKSEIMKAVASILIRINSCPIVMMSDLESLDSDNLAELNKIAEENNFIIIGDMVVNDFDEITVVGYEEI